MRLLFAYAVVAPVWLGNVVFDLDEAGTLPPSLEIAAVIVGAVGVLSLIYGEWTVRRVHLNGKSAERLDFSYRTRFYFLLAGATIPWLVAVVIAFVNSDPRVLFVAAPFTVFGLFRAAPTSKRIARDQAVLDADGSTLSLNDILRTHDAELAS